MFEPGKFYIARFNETHFYILQIIGVDKANTIVLCRMMKFGRLGNFKYEYSILHSDNGIFKIATEIRQEVL